MSYKTYYDYGRFLLKAANFVICVIIIVALTFLTTRYYDHASEISDKTAVIATLTKSVGALTMAVDNQKTTVTARGQQLPYGELYSSIVPPQAISTPEVPDEHLIPVKAHGSKK